MGISERGTSSGMMACQAGLFIAEPMLSRKVKSRRVIGEDDAGDGEDGEDGDADVEHPDLPEDVERRRRS